MSIEISTRVWKFSHQKGTHKLFLLALADHANGDGYCYPGIERISEWCEVNERQARRISADLQATGQLFVKVGGGRNGTNEYMITAGMTGDEMEAVLVKYFGATRKEANEIAQTVLEKQYNTANKNPVLQTPPVIEDRNPVMQDTNPVLQTPRTVINRHESKQQKGAPPISEPLPEETPQVNVYASYNTAFGEPIQNYGSPRTINAVEDLESFPGAWLDEAFLRTSKRERSTNEKWKEYQRFPYALQLLNEWRRAGGIQPEQKPPVYSPRREQFARPSAPAPEPYRPKTPEEVAAFHAKLAATRAAMARGSP